MIKEGELTVVKGEQSTIYIIFNELFVSKFSVKVDETETIMLKDCKK